MIYVIIKMGVYQQGVFGVFSDLEQAKDTAKVLAEKDVDAYHSYDVMETTLNTPPRVKCDDEDGCQLLSEEVVFSVNKNGILGEQDV